MLHYDPQDELMKKAEEKLRGEKPAGKYHPPNKNGSFLKMERYDNTPMMELQKGLFQHGHIWRILDTMAPSTIKLYLADGYFNVKETYVKGNFYNPKTGSSII